jgi:hypothetical protein
MLVRVGLSLLCVAALAVWPSSAQSQPARIDDVLARAMRYVGSFLTNYSSLVAEERYVQDTTSPPRHRELRADFLLVKAPAVIPDWFQFRDVFDVDGQPVRDRDERLGRLFLQPGADAIKRAKEINSEGARYNLEDVGSASKPLSAMALLQDRYKNRFRFALGRRDKDVGPDVWLVNFVEWAVPTVFRRVEGNRDLPARGHMWIEETTGRVVKTELSLGGATEIVTVFQFDAGLQMDVPVEMRDTYLLPNNNMLSGVATYSRYRRFDVRTEEAFR